MNESKEDLESRLASEVQEAQRRLQAAKAEERPEAIRKLSEALENFTRVVLPQYSLKK